MTDQQKLSKAIQDEIGKRCMRELALNSLRFYAWKNLCDLTEKQIAEIDAQIIGGRVPDAPTLSRTDA